MIVLWGRTLVVSVVLAVAAPAVAVAQVETSTQTPDGTPYARVEARRFVHDGHVFVRAGFAWWSRDDLRVNPGVTVEGTWYVSETIGLDVASVTVFFSQLAAAADALRRQTGLLPDSEKPLVRAMTGARWGFAYGKWLIEDLGVVLHADAAARVHAGLVITDAAVNPGGDLGLTLQLRLGERGLLWLDGGWLSSYEDREATSFASGLLVNAGLGLTW
jgi:hypothetical protein